MIRGQSLALPLLFLLAGCADSPDRTTQSPGGYDPTASSTDQPAPDVPNCCDEVSAPLRVELHDCQYYIILFASGSSQQAAELPPDFIPQQYAAGTGTTNINSLDCKFAVFGNESVEADVQFIAVMGVVQAPQDRNHPDFTDTYFYEVATNSAKLKDTMRSHGFLPESGSIATSVETQTVSMTFKVADATYQYTGAGLIGNGSSDSQASLRVHQSTTFLQWNEDARLPGFDQSGTLTATSGVVSRIKSAPTDATPASSGIGWINLVLDFSKETPS